MRSRHSSRRLLICGILLAVMTRLDGISVSAALLAQCSEGGALDGFVHLGDDAQGFSEYRHELTDIIFVCLPGEGGQVGSPVDECGRAPDRREGSLHPVVIVHACKAEAFAFQRSDSNDDGWIDNSDVVHTLLYLFVGGRVSPCRDAADSDDDGKLPISDPVGVLRLVFGEGVLPPAPFPDCGSDPSTDELECLAPTANCV